MRISDSPFLVGLSLADRRRIVRQAALEQGRRVEDLVEEVFRESARAAEEAVRPVSYWASIARANARNPSPTPVEFWATLEQERRVRAEIEQRTANRAESGVGQAPNAPFRAPPGITRPVVGPGLSPVEFARGSASRRAEGTPVIAEISLPARNPRTALIIRGEVVSPVGRIVDVFA